MNRHLLSQPVDTRACEAWDHDELNDLSRQLYSMRDPKLSQIYESRDDKRKFHFDGLDYKEKIWTTEKDLADWMPEQWGPGSENHAVARDGKCAELVMWWIHHLPAKARDALSNIHGFQLPLLPADGLRQTENSEYVYQISCSDCHSTGKKPSVEVNSTTATGIPMKPPAPPAVSEGNVDCPKDAKTGLPSVWYAPMNATGRRKKRCDWDYDPPCQMCEGIGGYIWGEQEHEIRYTSCTPLVKPADIPLDNRTNPSWPMKFTVKEYTVLIKQENTGGRFPGADPCATHKFSNDTETFYYDGTGPNIRTDTTESTIWTLDSADMFIKIKPFFHIGVFCICVTPHESGTSGNVPIGPLVHDFAKDAVLLGRERIGLEGLNVQVVADHYVKGPHHFWIDVATNRMVRGWQPYNGLNVYYDWDVSAPDPALFEVDKSCYKYLLHKNISCIAPYPEPPAMTGLMSSTFRR